MEAILRKSRGDVLVKFMDREVFLWKLYLGSHVVTFWSNSWAEKCSYGSYT